MASHNLKRNFLAAFTMAAALALPAAAQRYGSGPVVATATPAEAQWMTFMREEEKLARDVYQALYARWGTPVFDNIAASEQRHFDAVGNLMVRYGVADTADNTPGVFKNAELAKLYTELVGKGSASLPEALAVGVLVEKTDIGSLESALKDASKTDIKRVYTNLMDASYNHLEAFEVGCAAIVN